MEEEEEEEKRGYTCCALYTGIQRECELVRREAQWLLLLLAC